MKHVRIVNRTRNTVLGTRIGLADRLHLRLRGFLARPEPTPGEGLLLTPCRGVHMWGMSFPLDVIFVDAAGRVLAIYPGLPPGARSPLERNAVGAIELPVGTAQRTGTSVGDLLHTEPADNVRPIPVHEPVRATGESVWSSGVPASGAAAIAFPSAEDLAVRRTQRTEADWGITS